MATPSMVVLKANAIVISEKTNKLFCSICNFDYNCKDWTSHIEKGIHVATLERFDETFENLEENARCKICKAKIVWDMIRTHGKSHMIVPWYEPDDKNKILYENHTLKFRTNYHCYLCDEIFQEWSTAYVHTGNSKHQNIVQQIRQSVPKRASKKFYGELISAGFVPGMNGTVECRFCNETNLGYYTMDEHRREPNHTRNKSIFIDKLFKRMENENKSRKSKKEASSTQVESRAWQQIPPPESVAAPANRHMICNFFLEHNAEETANRKKIEEQKNVNCQEFIVDYVVSAAHPLCEEAKAKTARSKRGKITKPTMDQTDPFCLICRCEIPGYPAVKDHITGVRHAMSRERYRCEDILAIDCITYYCRSCDCTITGFENVYRHVIDDSHSKSTETAIPVQSEEKVTRKNRKAPKKIANGMEIRDTESSFLHGKSNSAGFVSDEEKLARKTHKAPEKFADGMEIPREAENSISQNEHCMYVVRRNAKKSFCQICDETPYPVGSKNLKEHIAGERHKLALIRYGCDNIVASASAYHCRCCDLELADLENVYLHVKDKRHTSSMIKVARMEEARAPKRTRDKFEAQFYSEDPTSQPCGIMLSDYIVEKIPSCSSGFLNEQAKDAPVNDLFHGQSFYRSLNQTRLELPTQPNNQNAFLNNSVRQTGFWKFPSNFDAASQPTSDMTSFRRMLAARYAQPQAGAIYTNMLNEVEASRRPDQGYWSATSGQPELNSLRSSMASELSRFLEFSETNQAKNVPRPRFDERSKKQLNLIPMKKIRCNLCELSFFDTMQLHVHMASHFTEEFARPTRNSCTNGAMENDSENDRNLPKLAESPQFGVAINGDVLHSNGDDATISGEAGQDIERFARQKTAIENDDEAAKHTPKVANLKNVIELLDFDEDSIYELSDKLADVKRGTQLCFTVDSNEIYCLICQEVVENTLKNYLEHLTSVDHCEYLEMMENDSALFRDVPNQISDMDLAHEYMQEISDDAVRCFICDRETANNEPSIEEHIYDKIHERRCAEIRERAARNFEDIKSLVQCDWYKVQKYWCVVCNMITASEVYFVKHLASRKHAFALRQPENGGKKMIYDFCAACGVLWYGYRCSYAYHSDIESHKWLARDGYYLSPELPIFARSLLVAPEAFVENKIKCLDENLESERAKEETLIRDMESAVKTKFPRAKAYTFGSRASGLGSPESDIDVYLDRGKTYDGNDVSESQMTYFMTGVHRCLIADAQTWDVEELLTNCRSPIIRAHHRATGLNCDISFQNGLSVENTKLIKTLNNVFPTCRKLILFLKQWTAYCGLDGSKGISSYALYWYVIFYLQKESILPSIATLISMSKKSHIIAGWEVSFSQNFSYNKLESNYSTKEFLTKFFKFYANFDYRYYVACPLLGKELEKRDFVETEKLPKEMALYVEYMRNYEKKPEPLRIDSVMCIQDPIDLQHNLTKAVSKVYLNRFRTYCSKSLDLLCST